MQQIDNAQGLTFTAESESSVTGFESVVAAYLGSRLDLTDHMQALVESAPGMPMGIVANAFFNLMMGDAAGVRRAQRGLSRLVAIPSLNERETLYHQALINWCADRLGAAANDLEGVLERYPTDALALRVAQYLHFYAGSAERMRDSAARVYPKWSPDDLHYGFMQGVYAFGLEEAGDYAEAERQGRAAVERNPADIWAAHAVAHVFEMHGKSADGLAWLDPLIDGFDGTNGFRFHLWWHKSLFLLAEGDVDGALALYDLRVVEDLDADFYLDQCNATSLLVRLELAGVDVGERWSVLVDIAQKHADDQELVFASVHHLLALARLGRRDAVEHLVATLGQWREGDQGDTARAVGADLGRAIVDYYMGRYGSSAAAFRAAEPRLHCIGGSHAQRNVFKLLRADAEASLS